ncbi:MAG TPA: ANTAR domain-containing protein [Microlunatus sp.]|nr:ANTAR domain-containing protein [Microlunatus sp.]
MDVSRSLSEQLSALTDALDDPGTDLSGILGVLVDDLTEAVPSFLGLQMTLDLNGRPFTLNTIADGDTDAARTTLQLPLDPLAGTGPGSAVIFYAAAPGAFLDLAADAHQAWGLDGQVHLDQHLPARDTPTGHDAPGPASDDLHRWSIVNRAVGILIARGHTPEQARNEIRRAAGHRRITEPEVAEGIVRSLLGADDAQTEPDR